MTLIPPAHNFRRSSALPAGRIEDHEKRFQRAPLCRCSTIFNLATATERAVVLAREEGVRRNSDALAPAISRWSRTSREFVGRVDTTFLDPSRILSPGSGAVLATSRPTSAPLDVAVQRIDPNGSNPYVQANAPDSAQAWCRLPLRSTTSWCCATGARR